MSFGFSVGDIILLSQLSYNLYTTVTSGRHHASRDLEELDQALFGLYCALSHLRHVAKDIAAVATDANPTDTHTQEAWQALNQIVQNCAATLEDLDLATKKYRENARRDHGEGDVNANSVHTRRKRLMRILESNLSNGRWDMNKETLKAYRDKLQSHVDAINLVLNVFNWSNTQKIRADGTADAQKMQEFQERMVASNSVLETLVKDMCSKLALSQDTGPLPTTMCFAHIPTTSPKTVTGSQDLQSSQTPSSKPASEVVKSSSGRIDSVFACYAMSTANTSPLVARGTTARALMSANESVEPLDEQEATRSPKHQTNAIPAVPPAIVAINARRTSYGAKTLAAFSKRSIPMLRPRFMNPAVPSLHELKEGLAYVFSPLLARTPHRLHLEKEIRRKEIGIWIQSLDNLLEEQAWRMPSRVAKGAKSLSEEIVNDLIDLLCSLNEATEKSDIDSLALFYQSSHTAKFDRVLDKLLTLTKSVRACKEVEELVEERECWGQQHQRYV